jgi:branched-chain amino acid transport system substrate-binding protein
MITRRTALSGLAAAGFADAIDRAGAANTPEVTKSEIKIGNTLPYSGPASSFGASLGRCDSAYFRMINDNGGIAGHKVVFVSLDDGYSPPRTVEDTRRLAEQEKVDFLFGSQGTPTNTAIREYCNNHKIPQLFVATAASKWNDPQHYPWTIGWGPSYRTEARIYAKYMLQKKPDAKLSLLYQNDDYGKDYASGVRDVLGDRWDRIVVKTATYEATDATVSSQLIALKQAGADALLVVALPKFAAQAIRQVHDLNWKPMFFMTNGSISVGTVMVPAGPENAIGLLSTGFLKDPTDPIWDSDPGMKEFKAFMAKYLPDANIKDGAYIYAYSLTRTMQYVLEKCNGDFSRANVMKQATNIRSLVIPTLLPGITVNTSPTDYRPVNAMQLEQWDGKSWRRFGEIIVGA